MLLITLIFWQLHILKIMAIQNFYFIFHTNTFS